MSEATEQSALFDWCALNRNNLPELALLFHIPNGGSRNIIEAVNLKRQGVKAGVPDLFLPVPRGRFHGLFIEMKCGKNKLSDKQAEWLERLHQQGYMCFVCYGWEQAGEVIKGYLKG